MYSLEPQTQYKIHSKHRHDDDSSNLHEGGMTDERNALVEALEGVSSLIV